MRHWLLLMAGLSMLAPFRSAQGQQPDTALSPVALESFVKAHLAVSVLRGQTQAELADTKSKKTEVQAQLREKLLVGTQRILKENGLTEVEFARLTKRVSTDDAMRKAFDDVVSRLTGGKGPG